MTGEIFYWVLNMSIAATLTGACVYLLGKCKRIPRRLIKVLWIAPFLRMWIPFGISSKYGLMALLTKVATKTVTVTVPSFSDTPLSDMTMMNSIGIAQTYFPITYQVNTIENIITAASYVWIGGVCLFIAVFGICYALSMRDCKDAVHLTENLYLSSKIDAPAVYGILRPRILIPAAYKDSDLTFIKLHENMHIRRKDNLWRLAALICTAIHWFNPFAWLMLRAYLSDMELALDESVLAVCGEDQKKAYAASLLHYTKRSPFTVAGFGGARLRRRIESILSYKKLSLLSAISFASLAVVILYTLLTNSSA